MNPDWFAGAAVGSRIGRNAQRIYVVLGFLLIALAALGIRAGAYLLSIPNAVLGAWLLGGWPAIRRLATSPRMQLRHWWDVLRDTRRVNITEYPDGSKHVAIMRPLRRNGWEWVEDRQYKTDDRESIGDGDETRPDTLRVW